MVLRTPLNKIRFSQWADIMRQLRPSVTQEDISNLVPWRYKFVTSLRDDKVVGVGAYYPTASLIKGKFNYIADLVVDTKYRGKGIGAEMMSEILDTNLNCELDSGLARVEAHRFYHGLGFIHSGYAVRPPADILVSMGDLPTQPTYLVGGEDHSQAQHEDKIQAFIDVYAPRNVSYQFDLQLFMLNNPDHRLLTLQDEAGELEGILLFELQNRLSVDGNCFHVTDLIVKDGPGASERQQALLLSLLQQARDWKPNDGQSIRSVIVEMTEAEVNKHTLIKSGPVNKSPDGKSAKINLNSFFSVSAKHFVKAAPVSVNDQLPLANWHQQRSPRRR